MATKKDLKNYVSYLNNKYFHSSKNYLKISEAYGGYMVGITGKRGKNGKNLKWTSSGISPVGNDYHDTATNTINALKKADEKGWLKKTAMRENAKVRKRAKQKTWFPL